MPRFPLFSFFYSGGSQRCVLIGFLISDTSRKLSVSLVSHFSPPRPGRRSFFSSLPWQQHHPFRWRHVSLYARLGSRICSLLRVVKLGKPRVPSRQSTCSPGQSSKGQGSGGFWGRMILGGPLGECKEPMVSPPVLDLILSAGVVVAYLSRRGGESSFRLGLAERA